MDPDATSDFNFMEGIMSSLGLGTPLARFMGVAVAVSGVIWFVKPTYFFNETTKEPDPEAMVPWWALGIGAGAVAAFFL